MTECERDAEAIDVLQEPRAAGMCFVTHGEADAINRLVDRFPLYVALARAVAMERDFTTVGRSESVDHALAELRKEGAA